MKYYDLNNDKYLFEKENKGLKFLYNNVFGRLVLKLITLKFIVKMYAKYQNSKLSKHKIKKFIRKNNINMDEYINEDYKSFNDFFMRKIKPEKRKLEDGFISCCDAKLSVYKIDDNLSLKIKNSIYTIDELIGEDSSEFKNGYVLVYRLGVTDYHHYIYPFGGKVVSSKYIEGKLHTVQPIALKKYKVFSENSREVTFIESPLYGKVAIIEVGAMMIGRIVNEKVNTFKKGDEKGHFEFGGSTIIYLFENKININKKILEMTNNDIEVIVKMGQNIE